MEKPDWNENGYRDPRGRGAGRREGFTLCVFLCTPSLMLNENPLGLRPLLGNKE